jgi:hypothetical protein
VVTDSEKVGEINSGIWSCNEDNFPDMFSFFTEDCDDLKPQDADIVKILFDLHESAAQSLIL